MYVTCSSVCKISDRFSFNLFSSFISVSNLHWAVHVFLYQDNSNPMLQLHWVDPFQWRANFAAAWIWSILCKSVLQSCSIVFIMNFASMLFLLNSWFRNGYFVGLISRSVLFNSLLTNFHSWSDDYARNWLAEAFCQFGLWQWIQLPEVSINGYLRLSDQQFDFLVYISAKFKVISASCWPLQMSIEEFYLLLLKWRVL